jgi:hypothetical protein
MTLLIRSEIERLFREGQLHFLVCTSTLLEGVNLPAKSVFLRAPRRGQKTPLDTVDFWNLAGRAGRLGMEFQGNVVCVDPARWDPPTERGRYEIRRALDKVVNERTDELIGFIGRGTPRDEAIRNPELEHAFVFLLQESVGYGALARSPSAQLYHNSVLERLQAAIDSAATDLPIPEHVILRNPGISPLAQAALLRYFEREHFDNPEELLAPPPESEDAVQGYLRVIGRIGTHLSGEHPGRNYARAILVVNWMRGLPLSYIIAKNWDYWRSRGQRLPAVIRDTMREIEEYVRFRFAKYAYCYTDVLRVFLARVRPNLLEQVQDLNLMLEFGASQLTQISLMDLGLSRTSALAVARLIANDKLSRSECAEWVRQADVDALNLSKIVASEVARVRSGLL